MCIRDRSIGIDKKILIEGIGQRHMGGINDDIDDIAPIQCEKGLSRKRLSGFGWYETICRLTNTECLFNQYSFTSFPTENKCIHYELFKERYKRISDFFSSASFKDLYDVNLQWEIPIKSNNYVIGIPDFLISITLKDTNVGVNTFYFKTNNCHLRVVIEVKPKIVSIGETMRQIKLYKSYLPTKASHGYVYDNRIVLVTGSPDYKDLFERQGIHYFVLTRGMLNNGQRELEVKK